ncbi:MAG: hypothetical protein JWM68_1392 [Verrucomicrobiales bacterium]|nr:hypothetical protein [Verrucomicrobiales bacterium]
MRIDFIGCETSTRRGTSFRHRLSLIFFQNLLDPSRVSFGMPVAGQRIASAGGFDQNIGPDHSRFDMHRGDLGNTDADFVCAEERTFATNHRTFADLDHRRKKKITPCPSTGLESFNGHGNI